MTETRELKLAEDGGIIPAHIPNWNTIKMQEVTQWPSSDHSMEEAPDHTDTCGSTPGNRTPENCP